MAEEPQAVPEQKTYEPPNPTIKECIQLNQLMPIIEKNNHFYDFKLI